jgi:dephospho-CoA kinase
MAREHPGLILLTGMPGSGKEEFVKVCEERGITILHMGDFVRAEVQAQGLPMTDENVGGLAHKMREEKGFDIWAKRTADALNEKLTLIDGLRGRDEYDHFQERTKGSLVVVAIHASPSARFERLRKRGRSDAPATREDFDTRDERELRWGLGDVIARADYVLVNESSLEDFRAKAGKTLDEIIG